MAGLRDVRRSVSRRAVFWAAIRNGNAMRRTPETDAARTVRPGPHHESRAKGFPTHLDGKSSARFGRDVETYRQPRVQGTNFGTETEGEQAGGHRCRVRSKRSQGPQHASARDATNVSATPVANAKATPARTSGSFLLQGPRPNGGAGRDTRSWRFGSDIPAVIMKQPACADRMTPARGPARPELVEPLCEAMTRLRPTHDARSVPGEFNRSVQHLLILLDGEVSHADVTDIVHLEAEGRTVGAVEERTKRVGHLPGAGKEEQDRRPADRGSPWRYGAGATSQSCGGVEA